MFRKHGLCLELGFPPEFMAIWALHPERRNPWSTFWGVEPPNLPLRKTRQALFWLWVKIKKGGQTAGVGPCFHLPGQAMLEFRFVEPQPENTGKPQKGNRNPSGGVHCLSMHRSKLWRCCRERRPWMTSRVRGTCGCGSKWKPLVNIKIGGTCSSAPKWRHRL